MKRNIKTIGYSVVALMVLGAVLSFSSIGKTFAAQNDSFSDPSPLIHRGGGHQYITEPVGIGHAVINNVAFDASSSENHPAVFEKPNDSSESFLASLDTSWVGGDVFIGVPRDPSGDAGFDYHGTFNMNSLTNPWVFNYNPGIGDPLTAPFQKVNVWRSVNIPGATNSSDGNVLATNLIHTTQNDQVCVNKEGSLVMCGSFSCTGNIPDSHATMCQGDNTGLTADTPKTLVSACTTDTKCEFTCMSGYHYDSSSKTCKLNICTGTVPTNAVLCSGDSQGLDQNTDITLVDNCGTNKCEYICDTNNGYKYDTTTETCVENVNVSVKCYTSNINDGDSAHPNGGSVDYIDKNGNQKTYSGIYKHHKAKIHYKTGTDIFPTAAQEIDCTPPDCNSYEEDQCDQGFHCCGDGSCMVDGANPDCTV